MCPRLTGDIGWAAARSWVAVDVWESTSDGAPCLLTSLVFTFFKYLYSEFVLVFGLITFFAGLMFWFITSKLSERYNLGLVPAVD